ncbi:MAG: histidinol-phosphatase [Lachnospiraceae bacterium]
MKVNYHTHTIRCHHASGSDEEYVLAAIRGGYQELGFSDHACWNYAGSFKPTIRMELSKFDQYYQSISELREKYRDQIRIRIGLECEYFPRYMDWLREFIKEKKLDYVIFGNHFDGSDEDGVYYGWTCDDDDILRKYIDDCIEGMSTGLYSYLAHPDLFMRGRPEFDETARAESERLCRWCREHDVILEYNLEGRKMCDERHVKGYPREEFWKVAAEIGNDVMIGVDAHSPYSLENSFYYDEAMKFLTGLGMNITDRMPYKF